MDIETANLLARPTSASEIERLTTNHETAIDEAFRRRLSLKVDFPVPEADERASMADAVLTLKEAQRLQEG